MENPHELDDLTFKTEQLLFSSLSFLYPLEEDQRTLRDVDSKHLVVSIYKPYIMWQFKRNKYTKLIDP